MIECCANSTLRVKKNQLIKLLQLLQLGKMLKRELSDLVTQNNFL